MTQRNNGAVCCGVTRDRDSRTGLRNNEEKKTEASMDRRREGSVGAWERRGKQNVVAWTEGQGADADDEGQRTEDGYVDMWIYEVWAWPFMKVPRRIVGK